MKETNSVKYSKVVGCSVFDKVKNKCIQWQKHSHTNTDMKSDNNIQDISYLFTSFQVNMFLFSGKFLPIWCFILFKMLATSEHVHWNYMLKQFLLSGNLMQLFCEQNKQNSEKRKHWITTNDNQNNKNGIEYSSLFAYFYCNRSVWVFSIQLLSFRCRLLVSAFSKTT